VAENSDCQPCQSEVRQNREAFWQREYYDRWIRSDKELASVVAYVEANPVKAGLAVCPKTGLGQALGTAPAARPPGAPGSNVETAKHRLKACATYSFRRHTTPTSSQYHSIPRQIDIPCGKGLLSAS
jgi:hypothetical protein